MFIEYMLYFCHLIFFLLSSRHVKRETEKQNKNIYLRVKA